MKLYRPGDGALLRPANQYVAHECYVEHVGREWIILKITDKAKQQTMRLVICAQSGE